MLIKTLNQKNFRVKKVYIFAKYIDSKDNNILKPNKFRLGKAYFLGHPIQTVVSKPLRLFYKIFCCLQNISTLKKSAHSTSRDKRGGGIMPPPPPFSFVTNRVQINFEGFFPFACMNEGYLLNVLLST